MFEKIILKYTIFHENDINTFRPSGKTIWNFPNSVPHVQCNFKVFALWQATVNFYVLFTTWKIFSKPLQGNIFYSQFFQISLSRYYTKTHKRWWINIQQYVLCLVSWKPALQIIGSLVAAIFARILTKSYLFPTWLLTSEDECKWV